ncbi:MAG TPA: hypothetical protein VF334_09085, partial [Polyangia bacterium]
MPYENKSYWSRLHELAPGALSTVGYPALGEGFNRVSYSRRLAAARTILERQGASFESVLEAAVGVGAYAPLWNEL